MRLARVIRESEVESHLVKTVRRLGDWAYKFASPSHRGVPDRLVCWPGGRAEFVELKAPGCKPTLQQIREHSRLKRLDFKVSVLDSVEAIDEWAEGPRPEPATVDSYIEATRGCTVKR